MSDHDIRDTLRRAASIVEDAGVPLDLRQAAFTYVLAGLAVPPARVTRKSRQRGARKTAQAGNGEAAHPGAPHSTRSRGPKTLLIELAGDSFFDDWRTLPDIQGHLRVLGRNYKQSAISPALLALTQDKVLQRDLRKGNKNREVFVYRRFGA